MNSIQFKSLVIDYLWHFKAAIHLKVLININFMLVLVTYENNEIKTHGMKNHSVTDSELFLQEQVSLSSVCTLIVKKKKTGNRMLKKHLRVLFGLMTVKLKHG